MEITDKTKFCRDCKWLEISVDEYGNISKIKNDAKCFHHTSQKEIDYADFLVKGYVDRECYIDAYSLRRKINPHIGTCGQEGKFWEPRE